MDGKDFVAKFLAVKNIILNVSGVLFRKEALADAIAKAGAGLHTMSMAGDWLLYANICLGGGKIAYDARSLNGHRRHGSSVTHTLKIEKHLGEIRDMQNFIAEKVRIDETTATAQKQHREEAEASLRGRKADGTFEGKEHSV